MKKMLRPAVCMMLGLFLASASLTPFSARKVAASEVTTETTVIGAEESEATTEPAAEITTEATEATTETEQASTEATETTSQTSEETTQATEATTETKPQEEVAELPNKIRTMTYTGRVKKKSALYSSYKSKKVRGYIKKGAKVEILGRSRKAKRIKFIYRGKKYYANYKNVSYTGCIYTTKKYTKKQKLNFVNKYKSKTKYLIWISHYTQQVNIFKGKKGSWKLIKTFICTTGNYDHRTPHGVFKIYRKEKKWDYYNRYELWISRFCSRNAFHTRIHRKKAYGGGYYYPDLGAPGSGGCIRLYDKDAKYIYDKMPKGTTVISY